MVYHVQTLANATLAKLNHIWSLNLNSFSNQLQLTCCKLNIDHISTIPCFILECALQCDVYTLLSRCLLLLDRSIAGRSSCFFEEWHPPSLDNKASKPHLIISIKTQFPSCSLMH